MTQTGLIQLYDGSVITEPFDVRRYGAIGDGVTDDTAAIQAAWDAAAAAGGGVIYYAGSASAYYHASAVVLTTAHTNCVGTGPAPGIGVLPATLRGDASIFVTSGTSGTTPLNGLTLANMTWANHSATHAVFADLRGLYSSTLRGIYTSGVTAGVDNIMLTDAVDVTFYDCRGSGGGRNGVLLQGACTNVRFFGGYLRAMQRASISNTGCTLCANLIIDGTICESNGRDPITFAHIAGAMGAGICLENVKGGRINAHCEGNFWADIILGGTVDGTTGAPTKTVGCNSLQIDGYFEAQSPDTTYCYDGIVLIAAKGIELNGFFEQHAQAELAIKETVEGDVTNISFRRLTWGSIPSSYCWDWKSRIFGTQDPTGWEIGYPGDMVIPVSEAVLVSGNPMNGNALQTVTLSASRLVAAPSSPFLGQRLGFVFTQDGTGGWNVTWNAIFKVTWSNTGNTAGKISTVFFVYDGAHFVQVGAQSPYV